MKNIYALLLLVMLPAIGLAQNHKKILGRWVEVKRWKVNNNPVSYTDTIRIEFLTGNEYIWHKYGSFIFRGTYKVEDNRLDIGMRDFDILEARNNKLVLRDQAGIYEFVPDKAVAPNAPPKMQETFAPVTSLSQMAGHWSPFKRTSSTTMQSVDYKRLVKMIDIYAIPTNGQIGQLFSTSDADNAPSWYIERFDNQTLYCNGKDKRVFKVIKCQDNELILEEGNITYFFRQFR